MLIVKTCQVVFARDLSLLDRLVLIQSIQDPYLKVYYANQHRKSAVKYHGGLNPRWDEAFVFDRTQDTSLRVQVWDHTTFAPDDMVGTGTADISELLNMPSGSIKTVQFDLISNGQKSGRITVVLETAGTYNPQALMPNNSTVNVNQTAYSTQQGFFTAGKGFATSNTTTTNQTHNKPQSQISNPVPYQISQLPNQSSLNRQPSNTRLPTVQASYPSGFGIGHKPHAIKSPQSTFQTGFGLRR